MAPALVAGVLAAPLTPAAAVPVASQSAGSFEPVHAKRVLDTRSGLGGPEGPVAPGQILSVNLAAARPVPGDGASAAVIDLTVPAQAPAGSLSVFPSGQAWDHRVTMSLTGGGTAQQRLTVRLGADGAVQIRNNASRNLHLLVDVLGFYVAGRGRTPTNLATSPAVPSSTVAAYNIVVSTDRPGQPALLGLYDADAPWSGSPTVSSTLSLQPSELTVPAGATDTVGVRNLFAAPETWLHAWLTGYYWTP